MERGAFRNYYKRYMDKIRGEQGGGFGWGGEKMQTIVIEQQ